MNTNEIELDALYIAWNEDKNTPHPKPLKEWIQAYPAQAQDLMAWASAEPIFQVAEERAVYALSEDRILAIGAEVLAAQRAKMETVSPSLTSLVATAKEKGLNVKTLAKRVGIGVTLIAKLQDRHLLANTVPALLIERLSEALEVTTDQIRTYLQQPPKLATGAMYKSSDVPTIGAQQAFSEALAEAMEMTAEEKALWIP